MKKIKIGILVNSSNQTNFTGEVLTNIFKNKDVCVNTIIINKLSKKKNLISNLGKYSLKRFVEKILFKILIIIEKFFFILFFKNFQFQKINLNDYKVKKIYISPIETNDGIRQDYTNEDIQKILQEKLDLIVRLEGGILKGKILTVAKYGVISYHHADNDIYRGLPPGFWEVYNKNITTGFIIQKLNKELDGGDVIFKGKIPTKFFFYYNQQFVYKQSAKYINLVLSRLSSAGEIKYLKKKKYKNKIFKDPNLIELFKYCSSTFYFILKKIIRKIFLKKHIWNVGFSKKRISEKKFKSLNMFKNFNNRFIADPFLIKYDRKSYIFAEDYCFKNKMGSISCFLLEKNTEKFLGKVLQEKFHLSFPFLFEFNKKIYMCPETSAINEIRVYECLEFPLKWKYKKTLIKNIYAVDTLLFKKNSIWWLLTNTDKNNIDYSSELSIYYSTEGPLTKNWKPHKKNPLIVDSNKARNGGLIIDNSKICRVNQKIGYNFYGKSISVNLIKKISKDDFVEERVNTINPNFNNKILGIHHLSYDGDYSAVDLLRSS